MERGGEMFKNMKKEETDYLTVSICLIFLGGIGGHQFFLGNKKKGFLYLGLACFNFISILLSLSGFEVFWILTIPSLVTAVMLFIDLYKLVAFKMVDKNGVLLTTERAWIRWFPLFYIVVNML